MARSSPSPSLDEYVVARGPEMLRTAWLLTGDDRAARELVQQSLADLWPHPTRGPRRGEGSLDAAARRALARRYLRRFGRRAVRRPYADPGGGAGDLFGSPPGAEPWALSDSAREADDAQLTREVMTALASLPVLQRAVVILCCDEGLSDAQVAEVLGRGVRTVHTQRARALAALGHVPALADPLDADAEDTLVDRVGATLRRIAPEPLGAAAARSAALLAPGAVVAPTGGGLDAVDLAEGARRYAAQARHRRAAAVGAGVVAVAVFGWLLAQGVTRDQGARLAQSPPALTCAGLPVDRGKPRAVSAALSTRATAVLVCADRSDASIWPGSLPPDEPLHLAQGLDYLPLGPPVDGDARCPRLPVGPAFTITVQGKDGRFVTYDNVDLACNGWPTLDQYFIALGEQQSVESFDPRIDPFPPCPSILGEELRVPHGGPPGIPKGTVFVTGSACLHQTPEPSAVPRFRRPDRSVLGSQALAALTREAATHGSGPAFAGCDDAVPGGPIVVARLVTQQGRLIELTGSPGCGLELLVNWTPGDYWTVAQGTADSVAADFGGFPR